MKHPKKFVVVADTSGGTAVVHEEVAQQHGYNSENGPVSPNELALIRESETKVLKEAKKAIIKQETRVVTIKD